MRRSKVTGAGVAAACCCLAAMLAVGCNGKRQPKMEQFNLTVAPDESVRQGELIVHIVGVPDDQVRLRRYDNEPVNAWFGGASELRNAHRTLIKEVVFSSQGQPSIVIPATDPIWKTWADNQVMYLVVLANPARTPGAVTDHSLDPRKRIIPLGDDHWSKPPKDLRIDIRLGGIDVMPPPTKPATVN